MRYLKIAITIMATTAQAAAAQDISAIGTLLPSVSDNAVSLVLILTILSLAPGIAIMITCFPFVVTVLSILRQSIGLQQSPPNMLIVALSIFLTWFIMEPILADAWELAAVPLSRGEIDVATAIARGIEPFRSFMSDRVDALALQRLDEVAPGPNSDLDRLAVLIPAFMISELQRAFEIGFLIALPFLIIDLTVSAVLMSMGMMMVPPVIVSLPFKLALFVAIDGWIIVTSALIGSV